MSLIEDWIKNDEDFKSLNALSVQLGYIDLKDFLEKNKDQITDNIHNEVIKESLK